MYELAKIPPLKAVFQNYLRRNWISISNDYSVTDLIKPVRITHLEKRHLNYFLRMPVTEDEAEKAMGSIHGTVLHGFFQKQLWAYAAANHADNYVVERKVFDKILDRKIVGKFDVWYDNQLWDWKTTSVWKKIYGKPGEFDEQQNIYDYMLSPNLPVEKLNIILIYRDWTKSKLKDPDYPYRPWELLVLENKWSREEQRRFIEERVQLLKDNENLSDDKLMPCTKDDMWCKDSSFAVMGPKPKYKKAMRVLPTKDECEEWIRKSKKPPGEKNKWWIEERKAKRTRCEEYCKVNIFCNQFKEYQDG